MDTQLNDVSIGKVMSIYKNFARKIKCILDAIGGTYFRTSMLPVRFLLPY